VPGLITGPGQSGYRIHASLASLNEGLPLELCGELVEEVVQVAHLHAGVTFEDDAAALERRLLGANRLTACRGFAIRIPRTRDQAVRVSGDTKGWTRHDGRGPQPSVERLLREGRFASRTRVALSPSTCERPYAHRTSTSLAWRS
jgi:hypothetical protein